MPASWLVYAISQYWESQFWFYTGSAGIGLVTLIVEHLRPRSNKPSMWIVLLTHVVRIPIYEQIHYAPWNTGWKDYAHNLICASVGYCIALFLARIWSLWQRKRRLRADMNDPEIKPAMDILSDEKADVQGTRSEEQPL